MQEFQESCNGRAASPLETSKVGKPEGTQGFLRSRGGHVQPWVPGPGPSGKGSWHVPTPAEVVNSAVGVRWPS